MVDLILKYAQNYAWACTDGNELGAMIAESELRAIFLMLYELDALEHWRDARHATWERLSGNDVLRAREAMARASRA